MNWNDSAWNVGICFVQNVQITVFVSTTNKDICRDKWESTASMLFSARNVSFSALSALGTL